MIYWAWYILNTMSLQMQIREEMVLAMKAKEAERVGTLRGVLAAFTNELVAKGRKPQEELTDEEALAVVKRLVKQRKDSIEQFRAGKREDLATKEEGELKILEAYLPPQMSREEIEKIARALKEKLGITDKAQMGQFMGALMKELKGQADGAVVKEVVSTLFS